MLNKQQLDDMLYQMSSFYRDYLPVDNQLMKLINAYSRTIDYVWTMLGEANDSRFVSSTRTLSTIPYYRINIDDGMYSQDTAKIISSLNFEDQISYLDKQSLYASLVFNQKDAVGEPSVYGMRLFVNFTDSEPMKLYQDYFLRSNRLYLLPSYILKRVQTVHYLHGFDIKINDNTLEKNFGNQFSLQVGPLLPRYEYRDVLEAFIRAFQGQMTIKSIRESILLATKWDGFEVQDYKSPTISPRKLRLYENMIISPFKFIVSLPESLIPDKIKINIVRTLLSEIKESHTDFMVFFDIERNDIYPLPMKAYPTITYLKGEEVDPEDEFSVRNISMKFFDYPLDVAGRYDSSYFYNFNTQYDDPPADEIVSLHLHPKLLKDDGEIPDTASITHYTLIIPRHFVGTTDSVTGDITFSTDSNTDATTQFQLYASSDLNGIYQLVDTVANDTGLTTINFTYNAKDSGMFYFKSRSTDGTNFSCFTLVTTVGGHKVFDDADLMDSTYVLDDTHTFDSVLDAETLISYLTGTPIHESFN